MLNKIFRCIWKISNFRIIFSHSEASTIFKTKSYWTIFFLILQVFFSGCRTSKIDFKGNRTRAEFFWQQGVDGQAVDGDVLGGGQKVEGEQQHREPEEVA